jgi:hypothetical protein
VYQVYHCPETRAVAGLEVIQTGVSVPYQLYHSPVFLPAQQRGMLWAGFPLAQQRRTVGQVPESGIGDLQANSGCGKLYKGLQPAAPLVGEDDLEEAHA